MSRKLVLRGHILFIILLIGLGLSAQGTVRGHIFDAESGDPVSYATVFLQGTTYGTSTDIDGFYSLNGIPAGDYNLVAQFLGYDSTAVMIVVKDGAITNKQLSMTVGGINLNTIEISAKKEQAKTEVQISKLSITPKEIQRLPSASGDPDIAQYLTVVPGVVFSGDQGGKLYIRGGSPIQTKVLLDGMTIYNPFHSIGFFSVFETDIIRNIDVLTGGFNAEHAGRISAVLDIKTREGNKKRFSGVLSGSPFQTKLLVEGPIKKLEGPGSGSASFILTGKYSYLDETSKEVYSHINNGEGLPYNFRDLYGKVSLVGGNGSKFNAFGFNYNDRANFSGISTFDWDSYGAGVNFTLIPLTSNFIVGGTIAFSDYKSSFSSPNSSAPRTSGVNGFNALIDFTYFGATSEVNYGIEVNGFSTDFSFRNNLGNTIEQKNNSTEIGGFVSFKEKFGGLVIEPSIRLQYYASLSEFSFEPRLGLKYNISDNLRFKMAGGLYSQNLISTINDRDVVNLFVGFLSGPDERIFDPNGDVASSRLQKAIHGVAGLEIDLPSQITLNIEPYFKDFTQLISLNRNKLNGTDSNFSTETGLAYGIDVSISKSIGDLDIWSTYSYAKVNRDDGEQVYPTNFDRRHNVNFLASMTFGATDAWESSIRWNFGSGFPFTQTQGFYSNFNFADGIETDVVQGNPDLGIIFADDRNGGRLPAYHRLDFSIKRHIKLGKYTKLTATASLTNAYDRDNIFYFDRVNQTRVDQLPILPSIGLRFEW